MNTLSTFLIIAVPVYLAWQCDKAVNQGYFVYANPWLIFGIIGMGILLLKRR